MDSLGVSSILTHPFVATTKSALHIFTLEGGPVFRCVIGVGIRKVMAINIMCVFCFIVCACFSVSASDRRRSDTCRGGH